MGRLSMSDPSGYDPDWWKSAKAASIDRKRRRGKSNALAKPGDTFLVVTEGTVTEPVYFEFLIRDLQLQAVTVFVIPGWASDPLHVINTAAKKVSDLRRRNSKGEQAVNEPQRFDHVWAVIDTDVAVRTGKWNNVKQRAKSKKVKLAHSTPCFEYWLLLHLQDTTRGDLIDGDAAKHALKKELGRDYSTNEETAREVLPAFIPSWPEAARRACRVRRYHDDAATPDPANPSTEVVQLVLALNDAAPEYARKPV
jgi:hypothetical protein